MVETKTERALADVALLRATITQFVPDGYRDEWGVWHPGPHRRAANAALNRLLKDLRQAWGDRVEA